MNNNMEIAFDMHRFVGKTVTIFTTSGGLSGAGFTGVLACVNERVVKLITCIGAPPCCPVGSACGGPWGNDCGRGCSDGGWGWGGGWGGRGGWGNSCGSGLWGNNWGGGRGGWGGNILGSVTEIPICAIVSFTHNAI